MEVAENAFGSTDAQALIQTLADVEAHLDAAELGEFMADAARFDAGVLHLAIGRRYEATFVPAGKRIDTSEAGEIVWSSVRRLKLMSMVPKHD